MRLTVLLAMLAGVSVAFQTSFNAEAQRLIGPFALVGISGLTTGLVGLTVTLFFGRPELSSRALGYSLASGVLGAVIVGSVSVAASQGGVARALSLVIGAQLVFSLIVDRLGLFGAGASDVTLLKVVGVALILIGGVIVVRY